MDFSFIDDSGLSIMFDPGISLTGAKAYLKANGFESGFGTQEILIKFKKFVDTKITDGNYAGKSLEFGKGGKAALAKHISIISGKYGDTLDKIDQKDWEEINEIGRLNYLVKYMTNTSN